MDNAYSIETKLASKNGWFSPSEGKNYYGRYDRSGVCIHWWGDGSGAGNHDNIVNYMLSQALQGVKSVNYVVSDNKITLVVGPDNVAWCQESGNATEVSFECQPTLGAEGYKKAGWLKWQLEQRYNRQLEIHGHNHWFQTDCPGSIDLGRIEAECRKWASGGYNPAPAPAPKPPAATADLEWIKLPAPATYRYNLQPTNLYNFNQTAWTGFGAPIKQFNKNDTFEAVAKVINHTLKGATYLVTKYSYDRQITNGVNEKDVTLLIPPAPGPAPAAPPAPAPEPPPVPAHPADNNWLKLSLQALISDIQAILDKL